VNNLLVRSIIAVIFAPLLLILFWKGGIMLGIFLTLLSMGMILEFIRFAKNPPNIVQKILLLMLCITINLSVYSNRLHLPLLISFFILFLFAELKNPIENSLSRIGIACFSLIYLALGPSLAYKITATSPWFAVFVLALIWATDSCAYFVGMLTGKHKLAPNISPNKTTEGLIGGILGGLAVAVIFLFISPELFPTVKTLVVAAITSLIAQYGDLLESKLKRDAGIKDSSNIIPGHGGLLDRFDSFLVVTPFIYLLIYLGILS